MNLKAIQARMKVVRQAQRELQERIDAQAPRAAPVAELVDREYAMYCELRALAQAAKAAKAAAR